MSQWDDPNVSGRAPHRSGPMIARLIAAKPIEGGSLPQQAARRYDWGVPTLAPVAQVDRTWVF